jgi:hypothetical protein
MLETAISIYERSRLFRNEAARSNFKYGCVLQDAGEYAEGRKRLLQAEETRRSILGKHWVTTTDEKEFDKLVMFWSR